MSASATAARLTRVGAILLATALVSAGLSGCAAAEPPGASKSGAASSDGWPRTVNTADGLLTLDKQPQRIVSTATTLTGSLVAIAAPVVASAATTPGVEGLSDEFGFFAQWSDPARALGVEKLYEDSSPSVERVAEFEPDLIVVAETGGDSSMDSVDQLRQIAPVIVVNYTGSLWQEVTRKLGEATGLEEAAEEVIAEYEAHVAEVREDITVPVEPVSALVAFDDGTGAGALTEDSPHGQVLEELGFTLAPVPDDVKGNTSMGGDERKDIVNLSTENIQRGLPGSTWILVSADETARKAVEEEPAFNTAPAVVSGNLYFTPGETFRLDFYSATMLVDSLHESFKK